MRFVFLGFPHFGGTFTACRLLRRGFAAAGHELRWLGAGAAAHRALADPVWAEERRFGEVVGAADETSEHRLALALAAAIDAGGYDAVFVNVLTSRAEMSVPRYLRSDVARVMLVHNITPATYAAARALRNHVHTTIGVSPRIRADLIQRHGFPPDRCHAIGYGLAATATAASADSRPDGRLRVVYLGRVEDAAKGVFWMPRILARLGPGVTLTVAGDGPDLAALQGRCAGLGDRVCFLGAVPADRVPALLAAHDALLAPSRFEGFCLTLIEAMAAGCVPVASRIAGVTDAIIEHGRTGLLFPVGDVRAAAHALSLITAASRRSSMSFAARAAARERFTPAAMTSRYLEAIATIRAAPPPLAPPLDPGRWRLPRSLLSDLRTCLPLPLKNVLRVVRERLAV